MSILNSEQCPFIQWNTNEYGDRVVTQVVNESIKVVDNTATLTYKPSYYHKVYISDATINSVLISFSEIDLDSVIQYNNQYKVNYNTGIIYFHSSIDGQSLNISVYYSEGLILYPASRIYTVAKNGTVTETLQDIINVNIITWQAPVVNYSDIATAYPSPTVGWAVQTTSDNKVYRWDGTSWKYIQQIPNVSGAGDMLKSTYDPQGKNADAFSRGNHTGTQLSSTKLASIDVTRKRVNIQYVTTDTTVISAIKTYGIYGYLNGIADCRGRT